MFNNIEKRDIRSIKTEMALIEAMHSLIEYHNFKKITVRDICEKAVISRAAFYAHFSDKYDFLKWWLVDVWPGYIINKDDTYEAREQKLNQFINKHKTMITNLFLDADRWTLDALYDAINSILCTFKEKTINMPENPKDIVLSNFYIGGMVYYMRWQVQNGFPQSLPTINIHLYEVMKEFQI